MQLSLFDFIEETVKLYEMKMPSFKYAEGKILKTFEEMKRNNKYESIISFYSRIKNTESLREKMLRNHFYLDYETPEDAIVHLNDLIGITAECRFIRNESELYKSLFQFFDDDGREFSRCKLNENVYMNLRMPQPQTQRNGFTIFRIDGYYMFNANRINFELQIKSLVHSFWNEIEHEVVYKNPDFIMYDKFNKDMLGAIRDNLDVVDRQLEIMYDEISYQSAQTQIGMDENGFKIFIARSINELVNRKMKETMGFATDFKQCSGTIAQYVYVHDFINSDHNPETMLNYMQMLNYLNDQPIDLKEEIALEEPYVSLDPFCRILGTYFVDRFNVDFNWHVFFYMLFLIQTGTNRHNFREFLHVYKRLLIQPSWYETMFVSHGEHAEDTRADMRGTLAEALVEVRSIKIIYEKKIYEVMKKFKDYTETVNHDYPTYEEYLKNKDRILNQLMHIVLAVFY